MPADAVIRFSDVHKSFGQHDVVKGLDLEVFRGEFLTLLGPSGCGKTTTLRMIGGFELPTSGRIEINDRDVSALAPYDRDTAMVFQEFALFPHMTVLDNVAFGLRMRGMGKAQRRSRAQEFLELVDMIDFAERYPAQLSGGQRQRVAIARSLIVSPSVLLLDEPLGALDAKLRRSMQFELRRIQREVGITFVYVTHDQEEALTMSDRVAIMNQGNIVQLSRPAEIYDRPETEFVAKFLGECNLVPGTVVSVEDDGRLTVRTDDFGVLRTSGSPRTAWREADRCQVVIRPEWLSIAPAPDARAIECRVTESSFTGPSTSLLVEGSHASYQVRVPGQSEFDPGDRLSIAWDADKLRAIAA